MNILDTIIAHKRTEIAARKAGTPASMLEKEALFNRKVLSLKEFLLNDARTGIIAEFKRRSPSKGLINGTADVVEVTSAYAKHASGLSVLTDEVFFGGSTADLKAARVNQVPILRKDFIVDEYQILEARAMGADVILLIAACLTPAEVKRLATFATQLGLEVLLELHDEEELAHICDETVLVGINNRDLRTFKVDIERSLGMAQRIPDNRIKIAESGINAVENILLFRKNGFRGFLIGENFMKAAEPAKAFESFVQELQAAIAR
ncbi:MAG: indole-3-glycerol phosphate synthase TrpC [Chitinophagaceae bacterium]|nr:indole-3-glycerol phosphate synthase TrpC [Chitinophagaceae bacterium]